MAVLGTPLNEGDMSAIMRSYEKDPFHELASRYIDVIKEAKDIRQINIYKDPQEFFKDPVCKEKLKELFVENAFFEKDPMYTSKESRKSYLESLDALFEHDVKGILEAAPLGSYNPMIGMTLPMHKNLLATTTFDKGGIPKDVAVAPKFTITMETRHMYAPDGTTIDLFLEQNKIKDLVEQSVPRKDIVFKLPEFFKTDVLGLLGATNKATANLSITTRVTKICIDNVWVAKGEEYWDESTNTIKVEDTGAKKVKVISVAPISFVPSYGQYDYSLNQSVIDIIVSEDATGDTPRKEIFKLDGIMHKNKLYLSATSETGTNNIKAIVVSAALDTSSAAYETPKVKWSARTDIFQIPDAPHFTVTVSPEEIKDVNVQYNVNQTTKLMSMLKLVNVNFKDSKILDGLDESFLNMPITSKVKGAFDFAPPPDQYIGSHISWRYETFMDYLDTLVTYLLQVLNDENMTISIFGRPELIRKITPQKYSFITPSTLGPVKLDYQKVVVNDEANRVYNFISSNKLRNDNNLIIILNPQNSNRVIYKIFDYQLYVGNEINDTNNYQLPALTMFERWLFISYQPVQGRIEIVNPTGLRDDIDNKTPVNKAVRSMNDYNANKVTYDIKTQQFVDRTKDLPGTARSAMDIMSKAPNEGDYASQTAPYAYKNPNYSTQDPNNGEVDTSK